MKCQVCGETAILHVTEVVDGKPVENHVCCAAHLGQAGSPDYPPEPPMQRSALWELWGEPGIRRALEDPVSRQTLIAYLLPPLCEALRDRHPDVRLRAAFILAELGGDAESAIGALRDALSDSDERVQMLAKAAIEHIETDSKKHSSKKRHPLFVI